MRFLVKLLPIIISIAGLFICTESHAQRAKDVSAEYTYVAEANISLSEAKRIAAERARVEALASEFGTNVSQTNTTQIKNSESDSRLDFLSIGSSEVKGEWLRDTKEPKYEVSLTDNNIIVKVTVWGEAREIKSASVELDVAILRNGKSKNYASEEFTEGDDMYVYLKSPIDGYTAVYLVDEEQEAYCLLPYSQDGSGQFEIEGGKEYIFFDIEQGKTEEERNLIDQLTLTCAKDIEHNQIYVIFSSEEFIKANDTQRSELIPRSLPFKDFQKWLTKNRISDHKMTVVNKLIKISK